MSFLAPDGATPVSGTYVFTVSVEGVASSATCVVTGVPETTGCSLAQPENPDLSQHPRIVTIKSVAGLEGFAVWVPSTPASLSLTLERDGAEIFQKSYTPVYTEVRNEPECAVRCRVYHETETLP